MAYNLGRPASIAGICDGQAASGEDEATPFPPGEYTVELRVGACEVTDENNNAEVPPPGSTMTGFDSVSRFFIEELPLSGDVC